MLLALNATFNTLTSTHANICYYRSDSVFITDIVCNQNYSHILHCEHVIKNNSTPCGGENSNSVLEITCRKSYSICCYGTLPYIRQ